MLLWIFFGSLLLIFGLIVWAKWDAFLALIATAIATGLVVGIGLDKLAGTITGGFGSTLGGIGITIGLGVMLGELLSASGATERIADSLLRRLGDRRAVMAVALTGWVVSIPVFFDAAFVILVSLIRHISKRTRISMVTLITALAVGLITTHAVVPPTPGPMVVAENLKANLGWLILYAIIISVIAILVVGVLYGRWIGRNAPPASDDDASGAQQETAAAAEPGTESLPSAALSFGLLALPIVLILANTVVSAVAPGTGAARLFAFLGDKNVALFIAVLASLFTLRSYFKAQTNAILSNAVKACGTILLITGAGGAFGSVISASGIGDYLVEVMQAWNLPIIILAFLFSQILRMALGSTTVALVTTSSVLGPVVAQLGVSPVLVALAISAGGIGLSLPNDSGFWVVTNFGGFEVRDTFKTWTVGGTLAGLVCLILVLILSLFQGILPGL